MGLMKLTLSDTGFELAQAESIKFKDLPAGQGAAHEIDLELLLARHIDLLLGEADETKDTLLIIGRQASTSTSKRMDLVALDATGAIVVIEVKRDAEDAKARADHGEMQAIRYAASLAKLKTPEELALNLLVPYFKANSWAINQEVRGSRTLEEHARHLLDSFISSNRISTDLLNHRQRIILVGASFDEDTTSAAAWLASNGLPIEVFQVNPHRIGSDHFLNTQQLIPPDRLEDFYTELRGPSGPKASGGTSGITRKYRIRLGEMISNGKVKTGDRLFYKGDDSATCEILDGATCLYEGQKTSYLKWATGRSGWQSVNIYEWLVHQPTGKRLEDLRVELEQELTGKEAVQP